jgi:hypothetical protein
MRKKNKITWLHVITHVLLIFYSLYFSKINGIIGALMFMLNWVVIKVRGDR